MPTHLSFLLHDELWGWFEVQVNLMKIWEEKYTEQELLPEDFQGVAGGVTFQVSAVQQWIALKHRYPLADMKYYNMC